MQIRGLHIFNRNNFNNDGLDIDGCKNVTISDIISDSDDDGIVLKSTSPSVCENVAITNCVISSHCNAIKMGTETNGGFKNIVISNCVVKPSDNQDTIFSGKRNGTSGISLEIVNGGIMQSISVLILLLKVPAVPLPDFPVFRVKNIRLSNIVMQQEGGGTAEDAQKQVPEKSKDYPEATMFGVLPAYGFYIRHAENVTFNRIELSTLKEDLRPAFYLDDVKSASPGNLQMEGNGKREAEIWLNQSQDVIIQGSSVKGNSGPFVKATGDKTEKIRIIHNMLENVAKIYSSEDNNEQAEIKEYGNK